LPLISALGLHHFLVTIWLLAHNLLKPVLIQPEFLNRIFYLLFTLWKVAPELTPHVFTYTWIHLSFSQELQVLFVLSDCVSYKSGAKDLSKLPAIVECFDLVFNQPVLIDIFLIKPKSAFILSVLKISNEPLYSDDGLSFTDVRSNDILFLLDGF
jgi:hypothetical protein